MLRQLCNLYLQSEEGMDVPQQSLEDRRSFISVEERVTPRVLLLHASSLQQPTLPGPVESCQSTDLCSINVISTSQKNILQKYLQCSQLKITLQKWRSSLGTIGAGFVILSFISFFNRSTAKAFQWLGLLHAHYKQQHDGTNEMFS